MKALHNTPQIAGRAADDGAAYELARLGRQLRRLRRDVGELKGLLQAPPAVPQLVGPYLTPTDRDVLLALDATACKDVDALHQRTGRSLGRIRESLSRLARSFPASVVKLGGGYRLTAEGQAVAAAIEKEGVAA